MTEMKNTLDGNNGRSCILEQKISTEEKSEQSMGKLCNLKWCHIPVIGVPEREEEII